MGKREKYFQKIEECKARYRELPLELLKKRYQHLNVMYKEGRIALREVIEEKEQEAQDRLAEENLS
jgi:hypothetical protein